MEEMDQQPTIRSFASSEWHTYRDLRLRALADSPDAFGSTLAQEKTRKDDSWAERLEKGANSALELPLLAEVGGVPVGLAWARIEPSTGEVAYLYQVWVAPAYRRLGIGKKMLEAVIDWARSKNVRFIELGVTTDESPAWRLYTREGFKPVGEPEPLRPGSELLSQPMRLDLKGADPA
jgi:ribosomal protein S18 acetylase RimI-like enzyme